MDRLRGDRELGAHLVQQTNVELAELGGGSETGKDGSRRVASANAESRKARGSRESIRGITTNLDALGEAHAGRTAHLGHVHDIKDTSGVKVSLDVVDTQVGTLVSLEGKLHVGGKHEGGFQDASTVGLDLTLVHVEFGVRKLGANLGGKTTVLALLGLDRYSDGSGILLALERYRVGKVIRQEAYNEVCVCVCWWRK